MAAVDGMRFVVPVPSIYARPNRKFFGPKRGVTWLNMLNDQGAGTGAKVVSGTERDSLHMIDVIFSQDGGQRPDIVADTGRTPTWCSASCSCWAWSTARRWPTCPTSGCGAPMPMPTTGP